MLITATVMQFREAHVKQRLALIVLALACVGCRADQKLKDGDIVFQTSRSSQSLAIQRATGSRYSHMGLIVHRDGKPYVFEAISTVQYTPLERWIARGTDKHCVIKRLATADTVLTPTALEGLRKAARKYEGRPYDFTFEWSDDRIYCSELVWKLYEGVLGVRIGELQTVRDLDLTDAVVRVKMKERFGENIPLDEPVISPASMFASPLFVTVKEQ